MQPAIVARARDGDADAFDVLGHAAAHRLMAVAYRILRHRHAEDAAQQTLVARGA